jgi:hypothetical protein
LIIEQEKDFAFCKLDQSNHCFYELENGQWSERIGEDNICLYEKIEENKFNVVLKDPKRDDLIFRLTNDTLYWGFNFVDDKFLVFKGEWRHRKIDFNQSRKLFPL